MSSFEFYEQYLSSGDAHIDQLASELISTGKAYEASQTLETAISLEEKGEALERALAERDMEAEQKEGLTALAHKGKRIRKSPSTTGQRPDGEIADYLEILPVGHAELEEMIREIIEKRSQHPEAPIDAILVKMQSSLERVPLSDHKRKEVLAFMEYVRQ